VKRASPMSAAAASALVLAAPSGAHGRGVDPSVWPGIGHAAGANRVSAGLGWGGALAVAASGSPESGLGDLGAIAEQAAWGSSVAAAAKVEGGGGANPFAPPGSGGKGLDDLKPAHAVSGVW